MLGVWWSVKYSHIANIVKDREFGTERCAIMLKNYVVYCIYKFVILSVTESRRKEMLTNCVRFHEDYRYISFYQ